MKKRYICINYKLQLSWYASHKKKFRYINYSYELENLIKYNSKISFI